MMMAHKPVQVAAWLKSRLPESNLDFSGHRTLQKTQVVHIKGNVVGQQVFRMAFDFTHALVTIATSLLCVELTK